MIVKTAKHTCAGGYDVNEDSLLCAESVWAVADGLGGHLDGEVASAAVVRSLEENCRGGYTDEKILEIIEAANAAAHSTAGFSTMAAVFAEKNVFRMANVGDSRVYFFRGGHIAAQTKDHSVCQVSVDLGMLKPEEIRGSEDRSRLLKVLGNEKGPDIKKCYPPIGIQDGDAFLICSDGFWEYVIENEMEEDLQRSSSPDEWLAFMLERHMARSGGTGDNYTAICGFLYREPETESKAAPPKKKARPAPLIAALAAAAAAGTALLIFSAVNNGRPPDGAQTDTVIGDSSDRREIQEAVLGYSSDTDTENIFTRGGIV